MHVLFQASEICRPLWSFISPIRVAVFFRFGFHMAWSAVNLVNDRRQALAIVAPSALCQTSLASSGKRWSVVVLVIVVVAPVKVLLPVLLIGALVSLTQVEFRAEKNLNLNEQLNGQVGLHYELDDCFQVWPENQSTKYQ